MHLFLGWRAMEDRIGSIGHRIEHCLWGDSRASHTFLAASTDEHPLIMIEIDVGNPSKNIRKSMNLIIKDIDDLPKTTYNVKLIGVASSPTALPDLIETAKKYVQEHPHYNVLGNNCRTFVEYLIDQIPEFRTTIPRKNGSILEYYHSRAKEDHPGAIHKSKEYLKHIHYLHRQNHEYKYANHLVLRVELPSLDDADNDNNINNNSNNAEIVEMQH